MIRWVQRTAALALMAGIAACSRPLPTSPTVVDLTVSAGPEVNPNNLGKAAPIVVRVYQLVSPSRFDKADFFQLFNQDQDFLNTDLVTRDDFLLKPGETKTMTLTPSDPVKVLGVLATYRDFQHATWRTTLPVPLHQTTKVTITAGRDGVSANTEPVKAGS